MDTPYRFDITGLQTLVEKHWTYHAPCHHLNWKVERVGEDLMQLDAAPVYQDILGGSQDGLKVWSGFSMHLSKLFAEPDVEVTEHGFMTYCIECTPTPFFGVNGKYKGRGFLLKLYLEPIPASETVEIIDTLKNETRSIIGRQP